LVHDVSGKGAAWARNKGLEDVKSRLVLFSDADIEWRPDAIGKMLAALNSDPSASLAFGSFRCDGILVGKPFKWDAESLKLKNFITTCSLVLREHFPGFDESLERHQDWDAWLTMAENGYHGVFAGELFSTAVRAGDISSGVRIGLEESKAVIREKHRLATVDIIVPVFASDDHLARLTVKCLSSVRASTRDYRLILIDNGSTHFTAVEGELEKHSSYRVISNPDNLGFVKAVNQGIAASTAPFVVLLNNDTETTPYWLDRLLFPMGQNPRIALAGPRTNAKSQWQGRESQRQGHVILKRGKPLAFFCVVMRRKAVDEIGMLDESFGLGLGDDDDYCAMAQKAGWYVAFCPTSLVLHHHRQTFKTMFTDSEVEKMQHQAAERLRGKHGDRV